MRALIAAALVLGLVSIALVAMVFGGLYMNRAPLFEPPGFGVRMGLYLRSNVAETSSQSVLPELSPLLLRGDPQSALRAVMRAAVELGWHEVTLDEDAGRVRATVVSSLFRFRDDVRVSVSTQRAGQTEINVRCASRVGRGDLGANAHHIMQLRDALRLRGMLQAGES
ncbi:MAG: hypothetical protein ACI9DC_001340 [Gammaproteobacteria bacterium]|jgi:uncharacterized protein (DUF1499 family)